MDMFDDRLEITSPGGMPGERRIEDFDVSSIPSIRRNPLLADMCERLRIMERRGSGFKKIFEDYSKKFANPGNRLPILESHAAYFRITFPNLLYGFRDEQLISMTPVVTPVVTPVEKPSEAVLDEIQRKVLIVLGNSIMSTSELAQSVGISQPKNMRRRYLRLLLDMHFIEYTLPQKPNSKLQKYRLTEKGHVWLKDNE